MRAETCDRCSKVSASPFSAAETAAGTLVGSVGVVAGLVAFGCCFPGHLPICSRSLREQGTSCSVKHLMCKLSAFWAGPRGHGQFPAWAVRGTPPSQGSFLGRTLQRDLPAQPLALLAAALARSQSWLFLSLQKPGRLRTDRGSGLCPRGPRLVLVETIH